MNQAHQIWALLEAHKIKPEILDQIGEIVSAAAKEAWQEGYDEGYDDGTEAGPDIDWLSDLETALRLIDTDRESARVYLDRCTKQAGKHLIEVAPCLL